MLARLPGDPLPHSGSCILGLSMPESADTCDSGSSHCSGASTIEDLATPHPLSSCLVSGFCFLTPSLPEETHPWLGAIVCCLPVTAMKELGSAPRHGVLRPGSCPAHPPASNQPTGCESVVGSSMQELQPELGPSGLQTWPWHRAEPRLTLTSPCHSATRRESSKACVHPFLPLPEGLLPDC